jgi:sodium/hydrogen exchanger-like protein 3
MFETYSEMGLENLQMIDYLIGFLSFFVVSLGGTLMGVVWGFGTAFVSRFTHHVKIIEPIFVFVMAYLSYLSAEMFHLSGILRYVALLRLASVCSNTLRRHRQLVPRHNLHSTRFRFDGKLCKQHSTHSSNQFACLTQASDSL